MVNQANYNKILNELGPNVTLIAVSKTKSVEEIKELYDLGQRDFGENYVQELIEKKERLPTDIRWHFIGHLQTNKVKQIAPFIYLVQSVDSSKLLNEINKQALKNNRTIDCLLQVHIAEEETKFGFDEKELNEFLSEFSDKTLSNIRVVGLMGMASLTDEISKVKSEFQQLKMIFNKLVPHNPQLKILSMGMSSDYRLAIEEGSNMIRIGSLIFGDRI